MSADTLRSWERRYGFPVPARTEGGHRLYTLEEVERLGVALRETQSIATAVAIARTRGDSPVGSSTLRGAFEVLDRERCDRVLEESLSLRSMERTVETVLIAAVEDLHAQGDAQLPAYEFAWRYAMAWLTVASRNASTPVSAERVVLLDSCGPSEPDAIHVQALELLLRRGGVDVMSFTRPGASETLVRLLRAARPAVVVLAGPNAQREDLHRLGRVAATLSGPVGVLDFRGAAAPATAERLDPRAVRAARQIIDALRVRALAH